MVLATLIYQSAWIGNNGLFKHSIGSSVSIVSKILHHASLVR